MRNILFSAPDKDWLNYEAALRAAFTEAGLDVHLARSMPADEVDYIIFAPSGPVADFTPFTRCKAVMGLWAGVETVVGNTTLTQPLVRMVDNGLTRGMVEWVCGHVLRHHLGMDRHIMGQNGVWQPDLPPLAAERTVSVFGIGALGAACAQALAGLGFQVTGWSRRAKSLPGITCLSGDDGLAQALGSAQIAVLLLPLTAMTENMMNAQRLALMPQGAVIINPGRGPLIDDTALLAALETGQIAHATLDVFRTEPLPADHPFWAHPRVTVTPHIAAATRATTAAKVIANNICRNEAGHDMHHRVDRTAGY